MATKPNEQKHAHQRSMPVEVDWFLPAVKGDLSLEASLDAVLIDLDKRHAFVKQLAARLKPMDSNFPDAISELLGQVKKFENTLDLRVGVLQGERLTPWFRPFHSQASGPFASKNLYLEPVLTEYSSLEVGRLKLALKRGWQEGSTELGALQRGPSLWTILLGLNESLHKICRLDEPYGDLDLAELSEQLPSHLESLVLRRFLLNVQVKLQECRQALERNFSRLEQACERLWAIQDREQEILESRERLQRRAQELKDNFRQQRDDRRKQRKGGTSKLRSALNELGFQELPDQVTLRNRYLELAKKYHPDLNRGDDEKFKKLSAAYKLLNESVIVPHEL